MGDVGTGWVAQPEHWSALAPGAVLEHGTHLMTVFDKGVHEGRRWLKVTPNGGLTMHGWWAESDDPDPLAMVLVRRDVLVGEVAR